MCFSAVALTSFFYVYRFPILRIFKVLVRALIFIFRIFRLRPLKNRFFLFSRLFGFSSGLYAGLVFVLCFSRYARQFSGVAANGALNVPVTR